MTSEGLGEMFEGDSSDMCAGKFPLVSMGGRAEDCYIYCFDCFDSGTLYYTNRAVKIDLVHLLYSRMSCVRMILILKVYAFLT